MADNVQPTEEVSIPMRTWDNRVPYGANPLPEEFPFIDVADNVQEVDVTFPFANDTETDYVEIEP